ncbi:MAG TPA: metallophosphoesterase [Phnomibacter sp.]|nr:metallophosphoesterase [Phnomibacter sp.]
MKRKEFLQVALPTAWLLCNGRISHATEALLDEFKSRKPLLRFVVMGDGHYGLKGTPYETYYETAINRVNALHAEKAFDFVVMNGDIVHDDASYLPAAKAALDKLHPPYFVSQGNHDHIDAAGWEATWKMPVNFERKFGKTSLLIGTTSNKVGKYLSPDMGWLKTALEAHKKQEHVLLFLHINPVGLSKYAVKTEGFTALVNQYKNVKVVFNSHDHDEEDVKMKDDIPFVYCAHFGGDWGTKYCGFRVAELYKDGSLLTYMLDPVQKRNERVL